LCGQVAPVQEEIISRQDAKYRQERQDFLLCVLGGILRLWETICFFGPLYGRGSVHKFPAISF
jgi:hypothetical protein